jgi:CBS domain-containing protein
MHSLAAIFRRKAGDCVSSAAVTVASDTDCAALVAQMTAAKASAAIVLDNGVLAGIVTERDVATKVAFKADPASPAHTVMTAPVETIGADDYLFHAIARMRRHGLRHMPVIGGNGAVLGIIDLHRAYEMSIAEMVDLTDRLTHDKSIDGLTQVKAAQVAVAARLFDETVPAPEIQALITDINRDIYARIVALQVADMSADEAWGPPPVAFCVIVMGSGGRGENFLYPDQDNGFILDDYPDSEHGRIDPWFIELAERMTLALDRVGLPLCEGYVMATNPIWRKTRSQWRDQIGAWMHQRQGVAARFADIFFDFVPAWGETEFATELRDTVTPLIAANRGFLRDMFDLQAEHRPAIGWFGRFISVTDKPEHKGKINMKHHGTLPLVEGVRLLALKHGVPATSTLARIEALRAADVLSADEQDYLAGGLHHVTYLLLRQQIADYSAGIPVSNFVDPKTLSERERDYLRDCFRALALFRKRLRGDFTDGIL